MTTRGAMAHLRRLLLFPLMRILAFKARDTESRFGPGLSCLWLSAVLALGSLPAVAISQSPCAGIRVNVSDIEGSTGTIACALFESAEGFPTEFLLSATSVVIIQIRKEQARCHFEDIPPGTYAVAAIHDENMNGKLDTNWLGVPTEGYGFSNEEKGVAGAPSFSDASFPYDGQHLELTLGLHY